MSREQSVIRGEVVKIAFRDEGEGYTVVRLRQRGGGELVAVGRMPPLSVGQEVELTGRWSLHPRYGMQFSVSSCRVRMPTDPEGLVKYLGSGLVKGLGPKLARRIVEHLGPDALGAIAENPGVLNQVPGIGPKRAQAIARALESERERHETISRLLSLGVGMAVAGKLWANYGSAAVDVLSTRPYELAVEVAGIGFATAERLARAVGIGPEHPARAVAGVQHTLVKALEEEGHMYLPREKLLKRAGQLLEQDPASLEPTLEELAARRKVVIHDRGSSPAVYLPRPWHWESSAASGLVRISRGLGLLESSRALKALKWVGKDLGLVLNPAQEGALHRTLTTALAVLSGGPGTGKTTLVRCLVRIVQRMGLPVELAAPTGRAARRLAEVGGLEAKTLHRLLGYNPGAGGFARGEHRGLEAAVVVVDEAAMIDSWLMSALVNAIREGTRVVLVGDENQLPPVGPGAPFAQILAWASHRVARLTQPVRHAGAWELVQAAHQILAGRMPRMSRVPDGRAQVVFVPETDPSRAAAKVVELVARVIPSRYGLSAGEVQVLVPMHRGVLGSRKLNQLLRAALNPHATGELAPGDRVVQTRNNYELGVFNGELGVVKEVREGAVVVAMDQGEVVYSPGDSSELELAYAMSVHKAQGSEYPAVVIALGTEHYPMLTRPLLYTAITRAKALAVIVGHPNALMRAIANAKVSRRYSLLAELAREAEKNQGAGTGLPT